MKIVDIRIEHYENRFEHHDKPSNYISRIKHKLKELGKEFQFTNFPVNSTFGKGYYR